MADPVAIEPFGDSALLVRLDSDAGGDDVADERRAAGRAQAISVAIEAIRGSRPAIRRAVPASASVLVPFDPLAIELDDVIALVGRTLASLPSTADGAATRDETPVPLDVPVRYGGSDGPDLDVVAERAGLRPADVVELHAGALYHVLFLGFAPGFAYLGGLPAALAMPRRTSPRQRVPAGSVAVAGRQTAIYPRSMPGGWQLIGRTELELFDATRADPALLRPGGTVRFVPDRGS